MYMIVPDGFEKFYPKNTLLKVEKFTYGTNQGAMAFWKELTLAMEDMGFECSKAEPCLYLKRHKKYGLLIFL